jgi:arylsulfatase A-like enzyme
MFTGTTAPRPPSYDEADVSDKPAFVRNRPRLSQAYRDRIDSWYPRRLESLQAVDEGIEQIVNTLAETGELDNTVFMFMSDNGWFQGEHRIAEQKLHVYEPSTRVPLMISGPGVQPGATVDEWTSNVDLVATILGLTGAQPGVAQDGMSLVPYLSGGPPVGRAVFHETSADERGYTAIRAGRWKYVEYATGERELYDLIADPHELASLHADPAQGPTMVRLAEMLQSLKNCQGSDCVVTGYQDSSP